MPLREYYFANYRLLADEGIAARESVRHLSRFTEPMPYTHTFTLRPGRAGELEEERTRALGCPMVFGTEFFTIHDTGSGWAFVDTPADERRFAEGVHRFLLCSRDYGEMTVFITDEPYYEEHLGRKIQPPVPLSGCIRATFEAGMAARDGLPLHASLVEKDGFGVLFLGPSGMGKSTQAKLWRDCLGADFLIGDRPALRRIGGEWRASGMPWDGKDGIHRRDSVPVKALVWLKQAKENRIWRLTQAGAMLALLRQAVMPVWDEPAMDSATASMAALAGELPFYRLECLPDEAAAHLACDTIFSGESDA